jgi:hypothetical protein
MDIPEENIHFWILDYQVGGNRRYKGKTHAPSGDLPEVHHLSTRLPKQLRAKYF